MIKEYFLEVPNIEVTLQAKNGVEGIELIQKKENEFDAMILDLIMPQKDGIEVLKYMQKNEVDKKEGAILVALFILYMAFVIIRN